MPMIQVENPSNCLLNRDPNTLETTLPSNSKCLLCPIRTGPAYGTIASESNGCLFVRSEKLQVGIVFTLGQSNFRVYQSRINAHEPM